MSLLAKIRGKERTKHILPEDLGHPELNLNDFALVNMMMVPTDFSFMVRECEKNAVFSDEIIRPPQVEFGISPDDLARMVKRPAIVIDNNRNIPDHRIHLVRRKAGKSLLASQYHFISDRLFLVVIELGQLIPGPNDNLTCIINGYEKKIPQAELIRGGNNILRDSAYNYLSLDTGIRIVARYFSSGIYS